MPCVGIGGGEGLCCAQEAPVPDVLVCQLLEEGSGANSPHLGGQRAGWLFGVCMLASCKGRAVLQPGMALACVCGQHWGRCLLISLDLALPLSNYVFNPGSMKTRWLGRERREAVCLDGGSPRRIVGRAPWGSGHPVLLGTSCP